MFGLVVVGFGGIFMLVFFFQTCKYTVSWVSSPRLNKVP